MDRVLIGNLRVLTRIGCGSREREAPQRLEFDVEVGVELQKAGASRELADTVCYVAVSELISTLSAEKPWVLLEELASAVTEAIFTRWPAALSVQLTIRKFPVVGADYVGIAMHRERLR